MSMSACISHFLSSSVRVMLLTFNLQAGQSFQPSIKQSGSRDSNLAVVGTEVRRVTTIFITSYNHYHLGSQQ